MEFRSSYPSFNGEFSVIDSDEETLILDWSLDEFQATAYIDLKYYKTKIIYKDINNFRNIIFKV